MEDNEQLATLVENAERDVKLVTELLDKSEKERKRLSEKNALLTMNGMLLRKLLAGFAAAVVVVVVFFLFFLSFFFFAPFSYKMSDPAKFLVPF